MRPCGVFSRSQSLIGLKEELLTKTLKNGQMLFYALEKSIVNSKTGKPIFYKDIAVAGHINLRKV
ncbi:hypothetical protein BEN48_09405 [Hymenobacter glacialis]|uniref:Uncharacterized protein n=1 Tax=Hymenobacter glacialis TaxID=1908236 RepID=A0A1G1TCI1_9BACT|nr:hypothetical protein BEN48_09405 [Hymenobacter glacialis]